MPTSEIPDPIYISAPKAAVLCGVSRNTICCWIRDGKLASYTTAGGKYLIRPTDLIKFMTTSGMFMPQALVEMASKDEHVHAANTPAKKETVPAAEASTVLVVDDDLRARELAVRALRMTGLNVIQAENGYEAMHLLVKNPNIKLVVLDLVMPGQDGIRTFREIRNQYKELPVIVLTGFMPEDKDKAFGEDEPDMLLTKPYSTADLQSAASAMLAD